MSMLVNVRERKAQRTQRCPDCGAPMRLSMIMPAPSSPREDEITYRCDACKIDLKRCYVRSDLSTASQRGGRPRAIGH